MILQVTVLQLILNHSISGVQNSEILYLFKVRFLTERMLSRSKDSLSWQGSEFQKFAVFHHEMIFSSSILDGFFCHNF